MKMWDVGVVVARLVRGVLTEHGNGNERMAKSGKQGMDGWTIQRIRIEVSKGDILGLGRH